MKMLLQKLGTTCCALATMSLVSSGIAADSGASLTVRVNQPAHRVAPTLWGIFFEDINLSADGGIYPELVRNRSFEDAQTPEYWTLSKPAGDQESAIQIDTSRPLNPMNRHSLRLRAKPGAVLRNPGFWGMNFVSGESYHVRLAARAEKDFSGNLGIILEKAEGGELARGQVTGLTTDWRYFDLTLKPSDADPHGKLGISVQGNGTLWLDMVSVMPAKTWKNHGLRIDLCEMLAGLKPAFVRFPGGCWVEGDDMAHMYNWKKTIGDIAHRQPLWNIWGYHATHGLGYHEYLQLSEDLAAEPLFCINVGMSHKENIPMDQMGQWVQDALDAVEYANGPTHTVWGALRAQHGHPAPFNLKYLEIGNENGGPPYYERWPLFYKAIKAAHPNIQLIANVWGGYPTNYAPDIIDEHYYNNPEFFMQQAYRYDSYDRKGPKVFVGEYAVTQGCGQGNLRGALGEAAFMTGMERNSDVVIMAAYAPLFVNVNHRKWNPDLINFDSSRVYGLPSYYVQKLFSEHRGDVVLPIELNSPAAINPIKEGAIGVGTWATQAEFKDIRITREGKTLYSADFAKGTSDWTKLGDGTWAVQDNAFRQTSMNQNVRAILANQKWDHYTYALKARKLGGDEGFLILFAVQDPEAKSWWNLGGWGNKRHALELGGVIGNEVDGQIETGRWYDIRIEVSQSRIQCYLDGKLIHDAKPPSVQALYASATLDTARNETVLKVVNTAPHALETDIRLTGVDRLAGPAQVILLASDKPEDENSLEQPEKVSPKSTTLPLTSPSFKHAFPGNSFTVLRVKNQ
ncbi:MAG TPA: alpha-L-arabinofuranosidase C-terminal domain-containing protein [Candidatus Paceibacterota bacterium]|nr:alpha-L-arabinofuranosidase C-terminal domain-containing protein [Verrucomicrobiota bacterium]HRY48293.1 alpha-L-arabinofuranosidase C-terminal domain-containing protein [Candidatus Paceibacterota bacterium]HSA00057.1 alpha-L-arabinofuranosidase C-terminal domain-containing protein [Candidatus Paceibacterota bacterium]